MQRRLLPHRRAVTALERLDVAVSVGDVDRLGIDRQTAIARLIARPPDLARSPAPASRPAPGIPRRTHPCRPAAPANRCRPGAPSSVRPFDEADLCFPLHVAISESDGTTLPLSKPHTTTSPTITGAAVPRSDSRGTCCSVYPQLMAIGRSKTCNVPSTLRTTTMSEPTAGSRQHFAVDADLHTCLPSAALNATTSPSVEPTTTRAGADARPPAQRQLGGRRHTVRPFLRSSARTSPSCDAAYKRSPSDAGRNPRRRAPRVTADAGAPDLVDLDARFHTRPARPADRPPCSCRRRLSAASKRRPAASAGTHHH